MACAEPAPSITTGCDGETADNAEAAARAALAAVPRSYRVAITVGISRNIETSIFAPGTRPAAFFLHACLTRALPGRHTAVLVNLGDGSPADRDVMLGMVFFLYKPALTRSLKDDWQLPDVPIYSWSEGRDMPIDVWVEAGAQSRTKSTPPPAAHLLYHQACS